MMNRQMTACSVPWTWSPCVNARDRLVVNPEDIGVDGIPVLGVNKARNMSDGAELHRHTAMEITVCERGVVKFDAEGRPWTLSPGTVFVTQPGTVHRLRSNVRGSVLRWLFVRLPKKNDSFLGLTADESDVLASRLKGLDAYLYRMPAADLRLIGDLLSDYGRSDAASEMRLTRHESSSIYPLINEMRRNPERDYPVEKLIAETQMSESSLAMAFKRTTGQTPHEFLVTCRIRKAMDILAKDPSVRITSLALDLGFASPQHFAARFRRETGKTPSAWRENSGRS